MNQIFICTMCGKSALKEEWIYVEHLEENNKKFIKTLPRCPVCNNQEYIIKLEREHKNDNRKH